MKNKLLVRTLTGAVLVAITVAFFLLRKIDVKLFDIYTAFLMVVGTYELSSKLFLFKISKDENGKEIKTLDTNGVCVTAFCITVISSLLIVPVFDLLNKVTVFSVLLAEFSVLAVMSVFSNEHGKFLLKGLLTTVYPKGILIAMLFANSLKENSLLALLLIFAIAPMTDVFAYLVGSTLKGKKLCPKISPNKTISGALGGLFGGVIISLVVAMIVRPVTAITENWKTYLIFLSLGIFGSVLTQLGDLTESYIKRKIGVKDMGFIFPGHGGVLDRIDGIMVASVLVTVVISLI